MKNKNSQKISIEIWGTYPPPVGGISIHLKRLFFNLRKFKNINVRFLNFSSKVNNTKDHIYKVNCIICELLRLLFKKNRIIHLHLLNPVFWYAVTLFGKKHDLMITLHGQNLRLKRNFLFSFMAKSALHKMKYIFLNDSDYRDFLLKKFNLPSERLKILSAFIPPLPYEKIGVSSEIQAFRAKKKFIISANAWRIYLRDGNDIYGIKNLLRLIEYLKNKKYDVGLIFCYTQEDAVFFSEIKEDIKRRNIQDDVLFVKIDKGNAFEIWEISNLFIRPTSYDIEGISVKEALNGGTPVIASDVCERPQEAILYNVNDFSELSQKTILALKRPRIFEFKYDNVPEKLYKYYTESKKGN